MKDNGVFLIKKEIGGIDVNLHAVRIAHGYASPETAELTDVSDCVYFAVKGRCNVALYEKNFTFEHFKKQYLSLLEPLKF